MGMKKTVKGMVVGGIALGLLVSGTGIKDASAASKKEIPTIFVHGLQGDNGSLSSLVSKLTGEKIRHDMTYGYSYKKMGMTIKQTIPVTYSGQRMTYFGQLNNKLGYADMTKSQGGYKGHKGAKNSYSVIHFDNHSMSLDDQEKVLNTVAKLEAKRLHVDTVNIVGHSMGGLLGAQYAIHATQGRTYTKVHKLVTVGSPITGSKNSEMLLLAQLGGADVYNDLKDGGSVVKGALKSKAMLSSATKVLSIGSKSDGFVTYGSSMGLSKIVKPSNFSSMTVNSGHTKYFDGSVGTDVAKRIAKEL